MITTITTLHDSTAGGRADQTTRPPPPQKPRPGAGRHPTLTLADRLLATVLHYRLALLQVAIAALFGVRPETINKRIRDTRRLLEQADYTIQPADQPLTTLEDLYDLATTTGITIPTRTTTAS